MKRILFLLLICGVAFGCDETPNERKFTPEMDMFLPEDSDWIYTGGQLVLGEPVDGATLNIKIANSYDRRATFSVEEVSGVYVPQTEIRLAAGPSISEVALPLQGTVDRDAPAELEFTVNIVFDETKTLTTTIAFETRDNPPFEFLLNADKSIKMTGSEHFRSDYNYFVLGDSYNDSSSQAYVELAYQNGFGCSISLKSYEIEKTSKAWDANPSDVYTVSLGSASLASGAAAGKIRLLLGGNSSERVTFIVKNIVLEIDGVEYQTEEDVLVFPQPKFRVFDMMITHNVASYDTYSKIGYDTLHLAGSDAITRIWLDQPLGSVDNPSISPFLYQWGRKEDGHQYAKSTITANGATSATNDPSTEAAYNGIFIRATSNTVSWQPSPNVADDMWSNKSGDSGGPANPCPAGYRVPTLDEMNPAVLNLMANFNPVMAAGRRAGNNGNIGANTQMWACTPNATNAHQAVVYVPATGAMNLAIVRSSGAAVRCINIPSSEQ